MILGYLCVPQEIWLWATLAGRSADLADQTMHRFNLAGPENRVAGTRRRDHRENPQPLEFVWQTRFFQKCIAASNARKSDPSEQIPSAAEHFYSAVT